MRPGVCQSRNPLRARYSPAGSSYCMVACHPLGGQYCSMCTALVYTYYACCSRAKRIPRHRYQFRDTISIDIAASGVPLGYNALCRSRALRQRCTCPPRYRANGPRQIWNELCRLAPSAVIRGECIYMHRSHFESYVRHAQLMPHTCRLQYHHVACSALQCACPGALMNAVACSSVNTLSVYAQTLYTCCYRSLSFVLGLRRSFVVERSHSSHAVQSARRRQRLTTTDFHSPGGAHGGHAPLLRHLYTFPPLLQNLCARRRLSLWH